MIRNLEQLGRQLLAAWNQIGLNQRISIGLATGALMAGLLAIGFWSQRADYSVLYSRLDDAEAGKVISALEVDKIPYKTSQGGGVISVPADRVYKVRMQMAGKGIGMYRMLQRLKKEFPRLQFGYYNRTRENFFPDGFEEGWPIW